jgi:hypothetical protein
VTKTAASPPKITNAPYSAPIGAGFTASVATTGTGKLAVLSTTPTICGASGLTVTFLLPGTCLLEGHVKATSTTTGGFGVAIPVIVRPANTGPLSWSRTKRIDKVTLGFEAVSCPTTTFCAAVDADDRALTFDGVSWSAPSAPLDPSGAQYASISCPSSSFCMVTDENGYATQFNGTTWAAGTKVETPSPLAFISVSCPTSTFCAAVDYPGNVRLFDGSTWGAPTKLTGAGGLGQISCPTTSFCAAIGTDAYTFNGVTWSSAMTFPQTQAYQTTSFELSCVSATFCEAVASNGLAFSFNGATWSASGRAGTKPATGPGMTLVPVSCASATFCTTIGTDGHSFVFNGLTWSKYAVADPVTTRLFDLSCPTSTFCLVTDELGRVVVGS